MRAIFDYTHLGRIRARAAKKWSSRPFLIADIADELCVRLALLAGHYPVVADLGCHGGEMVVSARKKGISMDRMIAIDPCPIFADRARRALMEKTTDKAKDKIMMDRALERIGGKATDKAMDKVTEKAMGKAKDKITIHAICGEWEQLALADASCDAVVSGFYLHWINDLPGLFLQIRRVLKPGGVFLAALAGAGTLAHLRRAMIAAESTLSNGAHIRISPFADIRAIGQLLQRTGFHEPVLSREAMRVEYSGIIPMAHDLRGLGQSNAHRTRSRRPPPPGFFAAVEKQAASAGTIEDVFDIIYLCAWNPLARPDDRGGKRKKSGNPGPHPPRAPIREAGADKDETRIPIHGRNRIKRGCMIPW